MRPGADAVHWFPDAPCTPTTDVAWRDGGWGRLLVVTLVHAPCQRRPLLGIMSDRGLSDEQDLALSVREFVPFLPLNGLYGLPDGFGLGLLVPGLDASWGPRVAFRQPAIPEHGQSVDHYRSVCVHQGPLGVDSSSLQCERRSIGSLE